MIRRRSPTPAGFVALDRGIYMSIPKVNNTAAVLDPNESAPNVILMFGWMGATTRHLQHYIHKYAELYPNATQIVVKCGASIYWSPEKRRQRRLRSVVEALECLGCLPSGSDTARVRPRVLTHTFSNGGALQLIAVGRVLRAKYPSVPASDILHSTLILDSSPTTGSFRSVHKAFTTAIRNVFLRYIALPLIFVGYSLRLFASKILGGEDATVEYYKELLQPNLLPWMGLQTPRLYVFSKRDEIVPWNEVQRHAEAAKALGFQVNCELYEKSAHVNHMRDDPDRYWSSVQALWKESCRAAKGKL